MTVKPHHDEYSIQGEILLRYYFYVVYLIKCSTYMFLINWCKPIGNDTSHGACIFVLHPSAVSFTIGSFSPSLFISQCVCYFPSSQKLPVDHLLSHANQNMRPTLTIFILGIQKRLYFVIILFVLRLLSFVISSILREVCQICRYWCFKCFPCLYVFRWHTYKEAQNETL